MRLFRSAAMVGLAKVVFNQARKPENQARIKEAVAKARQSRAGGRTRRT
jgi:hypothetical protein